VFCEVVCLLGVSGAAVGAAVGVGVGVAAVVLVSKFRVVHVVGAVALLFVLVGGWWKPINASTRRYASHNEVIPLVGVSAMKPLCVRLV